MGKYRGVETTFKPEMIKKLITMFKNGKTRAQFCSHYEISENTFEKWLKRSTDFAKAYEKAKAHARAYYESLQQDYLIEEHDGARLNNSQFNRIMNTRFNLADKRKIRIKELKKQKTLQKRIDVLFNNLEDGDVTPDELRALTGLLDTAIKVGQYETLDKRLSEIEQAQAIGSGEKDFIEVKDDRTLTMAEKMYFKSLED